jgi:hypothetical protein
MPQAGSGPVNRYSDPVLARWSPVSFPVMPHDLAPISVELSASQMVTNLLDKSVASVIISTSIMKMETVGLSKILVTANRTTPATPNLHFYCHENVKFVE